MHDGSILRGGRPDDGGQHLVARVVLPRLPVVEVGVLQVRGGRGLLGARRGRRVVVAARARGRPGGLGLLGRGRAFIHLNFQTKLPNPGGHQDAKKVGQNGTKLTN